MRWRLILVMMMVSASGAGLIQAQTAAPAALTVIKAGTLIDGQSETPLKNQLIFVRSEHIEKIADVSTAIPAEAKIVDLSGFTVLPGLVDAHTHLFLWGEVPLKADTTQTF